MKDYIVDDREFELIKRLRNLNEEEFAQFLLKIEKMEQLEGRKINNDVLIALLDGQA